MQRQAHIPRYHDDTILWRFFHLIGVHAPQELKTTSTLDLQPTAVINQIARDDSENLLVFPDGCRANTPSGEKKSYRPEFLLSVAPATNFSNFACKSKSRRRSKSNCSRAKENEISGIFGRALLRPKWSENSAVDGGRGESRRQQFYLHWKRGIIHFHGVS